MGKKGMMITAFILVGVFLLSSGCGPYLVPQQAVRKNQVAEVQQAILKGNLVNGFYGEGAMGQTPLILACANNAVDMVKLLLSKGADVNVADTNGWTPLMMAAAGDYLEIGRLLIEKDNNLNSVDRMGWTALMKAATNNAQNMAKLLIEKGADINLKNNSGQTALAIAQSNDLKEMVELLKKAGAK